MVLDYRHPSFKEIFSSSGLTVFKNMISLLKHARFWNNVIEKDRDLSEISSSQSFEVVFSVRDQELVDFRSVATGGLPLDEPFLKTNVNVYFCENVHF